MYLKVEHLGIAVKDLEKAIKVYESLSGADCYKRETVEEQKVETAFLRIGESKVELLRATDESSAIHKYIEKRGEGIHHVAFEVEDIHAEMNRLKSEGFRLLYESPGVGADNKLVNFIHPSEVNGVLVEICQEKQ